MTTIANASSNIKQRRTFCCKFGTSYYKFELTAIFFIFWEIIVSFSLQRTTVFSAILSLIYSTLLTNIILVNWSGDIICNCWLFRVFLPIITPDIFDNEAWKINSCHDQALLNLCCICCWSLNILKNMRRCTVIWTIGCCLLYLD